MVVAAPNSGIFSQCSANQGTCAIKLRFSDGVEIQVPRPYRAPSPPSLFFAAPSRRLSVACGKSGEDVVEGSGCRCEGASR